MTAQGYMSPVKASEIEDLIRRVCLARYGGKFDHDDNLLKAANAFTDAGQEFLRLLQGGAR